MDRRGVAGPIHLFKEIRTDLEYAPSSVIQVHLPSSSAFTVRPRQQHRILKTSPCYKDEDDFSKQFLATSSSIFFGRISSYPRSILWRVLQDRKVLELRSQDLSKNDSQTRRAGFTLQFLFPIPIKQRGIALVDGLQGRYINVFLLTMNNEIYTLNIDRDFFCNRSILESDVSRWCKIFKPATFSISTPHCLISNHARHVVVSLADGRLLQLTRGGEDDGSKWHESTYGDGHWGSSLRGLVRWQGSNTVRFDGVTLEQNTPVTLAVSPDQQHIFAVCLNHTLCVWNPTKSASVFSRDLLGKQREPQDTPKYLIDPANTNVLRLFQAGSGLENYGYYAVTFSPHDLGQFKFWGVRDPDYGDQGIQDLFPDDVLKGPDPDPDSQHQAIWRVEDFKIRAGTNGQDLEMWVLMRSNRRYRLYRTKFGLRSIQSDWQDGWCLVANHENRPDHVPVDSQIEDQDLKGYWLDYFFAPGNYPETILELALTLHLGRQNVDSDFAKLPLQERISTAVDLKVKNLENPDVLSSYKTALRQQWLSFYQGIEDLKRPTWNPLSIAFDDRNATPWIVFAGGCAPVRKLTKAETMSSNQPTVIAKSMHFLETPSVEMDDEEEPKLADELAVVIAAASGFRKSFNRQLQRINEVTLMEELWLDPQYSIPVRIQSYYERCNFAEEVSAEQLDELKAALDGIGGFSGLDTRVFEAILDSLEHQMADTSKLQFTTQGNHVLIAGTHDLVASSVELLTDLVALVVFLDMEIEPEAFSAQQLNGSQIYATLLDLLRKYQVIQWLATNVRVEKASR